MSTSTNLNASQKGLTPILIIIILAALVGGYLIYQNQPKTIPAPQPTIQPSTTSVPSASPAGDSGAPNGAAETTNWKTYINDSWDISLMYPQNYSLTIPDQREVVGCENVCIGSIFFSSTENEKQEIQSCLKSSDGCMVYPLRISFNTYTKGQNEGLENVLIRNGFIAKDQYTKITMDGLPAIEVPKPFTSFRSIFVDRGTDVVSIGIGAGIVEDNNAVILNTILKTLRFKR